MNLQKVFGYSLLILVVLLGVVGAGGVLNTIFSNEGAMARGGSFAAGYVVGYVGFWFLYILLLRYLWRTGKRLHLK